MTNHHVMHLLIGEQRIMLRTLIKKNIFFCYVPIYKCHYIRIFWYFLKCIKGSKIRSSWPTLWQHVDICSSPIFFRSIPRSPCNEGDMWAKLNPGAGTHWHSRWYLTSIITIIYNISQQYAHDAVVSFVVVILAGQGLFLWFVYSFPSLLLHWCWGNRTHSASKIALGIWITYFSAKPQQTWFCIRKVPPFVKYRNEPQRLKLRCG